MPSLPLFALTLSFIAAQQGGVTSFPGRRDLLPLEWSADVGAGFARPAVMGEVVYVLGLGAGAQLVCLALTDGLVRWRVPLEDELRPGQEEMGGRAPHADPLVFGDSVLTLGFGGGLTAFAAADGVPRWRIDLVEALGAKPVQFGFAASPLAIDGLIVVAVGAPGPGYVALDPASGAVRWSSARYASSYVTPVLTTIDGARHLVCVTGDETVGLDPANGRELWRVPHLQGGLTNFAMIHGTADGGVLVSGQGLRGLRRIDVAREPAVGDEGEGWRADERWHARRAQLTHGRVVALGGRLYGATSAQLVCVDEGTGALGFSMRGFAPCTLTEVGPLTAALNEDGDLALVRLAPDRIEVHARVALAAERAWTAPVVADRRLLVRAGARLAAFTLPPLDSLGAPGEVLETGGAPPALEEIVEPIAGAPPFPWTAAQRARILGTWTIGGEAEVEFYLADGALRARSDAHAGVTFSVTPESPTRAWIRALDAPYGIGALRLEVPYEAAPRALELHQGVDTYSLARPGGEARR